MCICLLVLQLLKNWNLFKIKARIYIILEGQNWRYKKIPVGMNSWINKDNIACKLTAEHKINICVLVHVVSVATNIGLYLYLHLIMLCNVNLLSSLYESVTSFFIISDIAILVLSYSMLFFVSGTNWYCQS